MFSRRKLAALVGEFLGTGALTLVVLAVSKSTIGLPYFVAIATGLAVAVLVFIFNTTAVGAQLNPAVTLGMWTIRKIKALDAVLNIALQFLGAYAAFSLFTFFVNTTIPTTNVDFSNRILVAEAVGAFILAFGWAAAVYNNYKGIALGSIVGVSYLVGILVASSAASGLLNPAVALGVQQFEWTTYVLGPVLGALIGFNLYSLLFAAPEKVVAVAAETAIVKEKPVVAEKAVVVEKPVAKKPVVTKKTTVAKPVAKKKTTTRAKRTTK